MDVLIMLIQHNIECHTSTITVMNHRIRTTNGVDLTRKGGSRPGTPKNFELTQQFFFRRVGVFIPRQISPKRKYFQNNLVMFSKVFFF